MFMEEFIAATSQLLLIPFSLQLGVTIGLSPTTYTVSEDVGSVGVSVSLQNGILARDVVVTLQTLNGTAMGEFLLKSQQRYGTMESSITFFPKPI